MLKNKFSLYDAYSYGFKVLLNNIGFFFLATLLGTLALVVMLLVLGVVNYPALQAIAIMSVSGKISIGCFDCILGGLFLTVLSVGWIKIALDLLDDKHVDYNYLFKFYYFVPRVLGVTLLRFVATILGVFLFIVPGIVIFQRLRFAKYFVVDKQESIMQALKSSWNLTDGSVINLVGFSVLNSCFSALIPIVPLCSQVEAHIYRQMLEKDLIQSSWVK